MVQILTLIVFSFFFCDFRISRSPCIYEWNGKTPDLPSMVIVVLCLPATAWTLHGSLTSILCTKSKQAHIWWPRRTSYFGFTRMGVFRTVEGAYNIGTLLNIISALFDSVTSASKWNVLLTFTQADRHTACRAQFYKAVKQKILFVKFHEFGPCSLCIWHDILKQRPYWGKRRQLIGR